MQETTAAFIDAASRDVGPFGAFIEDSYYSGSWPHNSMESGDLGTCPDAGRFCAIHDPVFALGWEF
jgi:hypothetical protein